MATLGMVNDPVVLDAVNDILTSINEDAVDSLVDLEDTDAINALRILERTNRHFQSRGWTFNSFDNWTLNVDKHNTYRIKWPDNLLYVHSDDYHLIKRDGYVYNLDDNTFKFSGDSITASVVLLLDFSSIPYQARDYIVAKASTEFSTRYLGDDSLTKVLQAREQEAWTYFNEYEHVAVQSNILSNTYVSGVKSRT